MSDNIEQHVENTPEDGSSVDAAAARISQIRQGAEPEPEVELPEPELQPMTDEETENLVQREQRERLDNYRLQLATEQQRLKEQEDEIKGLREYDPAEYSARMWEHRAQVENFDTALGQFQATVNELQEGAIKKAQKQFLNEQELLKQKIPGWNQSKADQLTKYLMRQGYSREQIQSVTDHKIIKAFWDQMQGVKRKTLPKRKPAQKYATGAHNDPALLQELDRRHVHKSTVQGAAERIRALMGS